MALGGATLAGLVAPALAQKPCPSRTVTLILGSGPGSGADLLCRLIAQGLGAALRQQFIADNRVGANGAIAGQALVRAKNDGHTLLFGSASGTVINQATQPKPPFDTLTDLVPIAQIGAGGVPVVVSPRIPATDMAGFIAHIKANPGKSQYASRGIGSSAHLIMEWRRTSPSAPTAGMACSRPRTRPSRSSPCSTARCSSCWPRPTSRPRHVC